MHRHPRRPLTALAAGALAVPLVVVGQPAGAAGAAPGDGEASEALQEAVTTEGVLEHLTAFQQIAEANGGDRAAGSPGDSASAAYVAEQLEASGYAVERQEFEFPYFAENAAPVLERVDPGPAAYPAEAFFTATYSGSGDVTAPVVPVDVAFPPPGAADSTSSGCEAEDFAGFPAGSIALLQRGTCTFLVKVQNAQAAGAAAVVIANEGQEGDPERTDAFAGTLGEPGATVPVLTTSSAVGQELAAAPATVRVAVDAVSEVRTTVNVIADSPGGDEGNVVVVGSHFDGVAEGPGQSDNASGAAAVLEVAQQFAESGTEPANRVRFAFWGAEELGLLGSAEYVSSLSPDQLVDLGLYLNFDMIGSPNFARFVYDGDGSSFGLVGPAGSQQIEALFNTHFDAAGLPYAGTEFDGRSDYQAFIDNGIPSGGLFTGAEGVKTEEEAALFGGVAGAAYDPCYHSACDTLATGEVEGRDPAVYGQLTDVVGNISTAALDTNSDAVAHAVATYAQDTSSVNGVQVTGSGDGGEGGGGGATAAVEAAGLLR